MKHKEKDLQNKEKAPQEQSGCGDCAQQCQGKYTALSKEAEVSHHDMGGQDLQLCTLVSQFLLAHLCQPLLSLSVGRSDQRLGSPVETAQPAKTCSGPHWCPLTRPVATGAEKSLAPSARKGLLPSFFSTLGGSVKAFFAGRVNLKFAKAQPGQGRSCHGKGQQAKGRSPAGQAGSGFATWEGRTRQQLWRGAPTLTHSLPQEPGTSDNPLPRQRLELIPPAAPDHASSHHKRPHPYGHLSWQRCPLQCSIKVLTLIQLHKIHTITLEHAMAQYNLLFFESYLPTGQDAED